jgi:uncharacterized membrane protein YhiD involved in acid resistance
MSSPEQRSFHDDHRACDDVATDRKGRSNEPPPRAHQIAGRKRLTNGAAAAAALALGIVAFLVSAYLSFGRPSGQVAQETPAVAQGTDAVAQPTTPVAEQDAESIIERIFGPERPLAQAVPDSRALQVVKMTLRLLLAALLAGLLAFRPHRHIGLLHRDPYVVQTHILLAVVASALMMIVADNAARAFGIFAAASLVRFRTNIRDPKEITVLLINLAIGLATGVGRWELAVILSVFVFATLGVLEYYESRQVFRRMELKVKTSKVADTDATLRKIFEKQNISAEVHELDREDEKHPLGRIAYYVSVSPRVSTDRMSEEIFSSDPHNVDSVEWHQKKISDTGR